MTNLKRIIMIVSVLVLTQFILHTNTIKSQDASTKPIKALHVFNMGDENAEQQYLSIINEFNHLYSRLGYPEIKYQVWKELEGRNGDYKYIQESTWPDQATYDKVHQHAEYKKLSKKYKDEWKKLGLVQVYNRYSPLN